MEASKDEHSSEVEALFRKVDSFLASSESEQAVASYEPSVDAAVRACEKAECLDPEALRAIIMR